METEFWPIILIGTGFVPYDLLYCCVEAGGDRVAIFLAKFSNCSLDAVRAGSWPGGYWSIEKSNRKFNGNIKMKIAEK